MNSTDQSDLASTDLSIRILVYPEDGEILAHALEMDIVSCGDTPEQALEHLLDDVKNQISFAIWKGDLSLIYKMAPQEIVDRWEELNRLGLAKTLIPSGEQTPEEKPLQTARTFGFSNQALVRLRERSQNFSPVCA